MSRTRLPAAAAGRGFLTLTRGQFDDLLARMPSVRAAVEAVVAERT